MCFQLAAARPTGAQQIRVPDDLDLKLSTTTHTVQLQSRISAFNGWNSVRASREGNGATSPWLRTNNPVIQNRTS